MLSPYRVLDLTDEKGLICGKILGDLGADVIKIERPGGDPARRLGPFYHDEVDPEKSLFWFAYNTSKRGVTLDIETAEGQGVFRKLVKTADMVVESFPPGYLDKLGLGYLALEKINPGIILVSITDFGQTGPYKDYKAPDIVGWAMGGFMHELGDTDRPPVQISHHSQVYLFAGAEAAIGAMMALHYREATGEGQQVDVSIHESVLHLAAGGVNEWDLNRTLQRRGEKPRATLPLPNMWPCQDGYVRISYHGGPPWKSYNLPLLQWMDDEGMGDDFLREFDWLTFGPETATPEIVAHIIEPTAKFFMAHTTAELNEGALKYGAILMPVATAADILASVQLAARGYWMKLEHPELGTTITYPGAFIQSSEGSPRLQRRAPLIGEHNDEVFNKELDLSKEQLLELRQVKNYSATAGKEGAKGKLSRPLEGIKVVDFGQLVTGPLVSKYLADHGAEVIKVEGRTRPDGYRSLSPLKGDIPSLDRGPAFFVYNSSKLSVALNLALPGGVEIAKRLVARADVVVENFAGGAMKRMGLGYDELKKVKPDIIMLSACMMGQTGPHSSRRGDGSQLTGFSGFSHLAGWPDRPPANLRIYTDFIGSPLAVATIVAALDYRRRTGKGQYIDLSQYEAGIQFISPILLDYVVNQRVGMRMGNSSPYAAPYGAYRCRGDDRWCAIAVYTHEEWQSFSRVIGSPSWTKDPRFSTFQARKQNEEELDRLVEEWTINHEAEEVMGLMQTVGVAAGVVQNIEDLVECDPQIRHRCYFWELDHPEVGRHHAPGQPFVLSKSPCEVRRVPLLGEHNEYALKELLGLSDDEIAELVIEGVVE